MPADIAAADMSGDGKLDRITASVDRGGSVAVLLNDGAGRFHRDQAYLSGATAPAVATADVKGDGLVDVLTANIGRRDLGVLLGLGGGRLGGARLIDGGDGPARKRRRDVRTQADLQGRR
jgi:VCBS repeat protein